MPWVGDGADFETDVHSIRHNRARDPRPLDPQGLRRPPGRGRSRRERPRPFGGSSVLLIASTACLVAGVGLAVRARRFGGRAALAESAAGVLLILGLALIGFGLPVFR